MNLKVGFSESNSSFSGKMSSNQTSFGCKHEDYIPVSGPPGKSAYEVAKENGFVGTEEEWLESLNGNTECSDLGLSVINGVLCVTYTE